MTDSTDWFADVAAALDDSTDTPAETEESTSLEIENAPDEHDQPDVAESPGESEETPEVAAEEPVSDETATDGAAPNWDSPENPHYLRAQQLDQMQAQARYLVEQAARQRAQELHTQRLKELADDDPERLHELQQFVTEAQTPIVQQAQRLEAEAEFASKLATVVDEAVKHVVPKAYQEKVYAEVERMMALPGGPDYLQRDLATRSAERAQFETELATLRAKNDELEKRMAARGILDERSANGADLVESGAGNALGFQQRWDAAETFDELFDAFADTLPH